MDELIGGWTGDHGTASTSALEQEGSWACGDIHLILRQRIDDLFDFLKYSWARVRTERRKPGGGSAGLQRANQGLRRQSRNPESLSPCTVELATQAEPVPIV